MPRIIKKVKVNCSWCGKEKEVPARMLAYTKNFYCDNSCKNKGFTKNLKPLHLHNLI